jgi:hypothetical protein
MILNFQKKINVIMFINENFKNNSNYFIWTKFQ